MLTEKVLYRAQVKATAGRDTRAVSSDGILNLTVTRPREFGGAERHEGSPQPKENRMTFLEDIPPPVPPPPAVAAFAGDRDPSRRYLLRASALLRGKSGACAHAEGGARPSESRGG